MFNCLYIVLRIVERLLLYTAQISVRIPPTTLDTQAVVECFTRCQCHWWIISSCGWVSSFVVECTSTDLAILSMTTDETQSQYRYHGWRWCAIYGSMKFRKPTHIAPSAVHRRNPPTPEQYLIDNATTIPFWQSKMWILIVILFLLGEEGKQTWPGWVMKLTPFIYCDSVPIRNWTVPICATRLRSFG